MLQIVLTNALQNELFVNSELLRMYCLQVGLVIYQTANTPNRLNTKSTQNFCFSGDHFHCKDVNVCVGEDTQLWERV